MVKKIVNEEEQKALEEKEAEIAIKQNIKKKRTTLSDWMATFVADNVMQYGQTIMDKLAKEDPREASRFLTNLLKYAAPPATDPDKAGPGRPANADKKKADSDADDALKKVNKLSKTYKKEE